MIIFNTTYHVDDEIHSDYLDYIRSTFIPQALESGFLYEARLARIVAQHNEPGTSYSLQFRVKNSDTLRLWLNTSGDSLNKELVARFGSKIAGFVTLLEEID
ncbi:MAG: hypothetical protein BGN96_07680 [Bacteroidales bacterium 45-6]|nr:MAG: hypothetical protein BGN96_07680 [Bacteroidales bacterium 45-6]